MVRRVPTSVFLLLSSVLAACGGSASGNGDPGGAGGPGGPGGGPPPTAGRGGRARGEARRADERVHRVAEVAPHHDHSAAGRGLPHAHCGAFWRACRAAARCCSRSIRRRSRRAWPRSSRMRAVARRRAGATPRRKRRARRRSRGGRGQPAGARAGRDGAAHDARPQLKALDEQIRQQRAELAYYRVTAPTAGVVGDIPVRQGDRVTKRDGADDRRRERRARDVRQRAGAAGAGAEARPAGADPR